VALVKVLSGNKGMSLWIQRHMTNGGQNTVGQSGNFVSSFVFSSFQLKRLVVY
jgi:hypothetical protein